MVFSTSDHYHDLLYKSAILLENSQPFWYAPARPLRIIFTVLACSSILNDATGLGIQGIDG